MAFDPVSTIGTVAGGLLNFFGQKDANKINVENAANNIALQREFAQNGVRWKVEDAQRAGVHPLFALGASTTGFAPVSVGATNSMAPLGEMAKDLGQDISRAVTAKQTATERVAGTVASAQQLESNNLDLEYKRLRVQDLRRRINNQQTQGSPPTPEFDTYSGLPTRAAVAADPSEGPPPPEHTGLRFGRTWETHPKVSDAQKFEDRYGEPGEWASAPFIFAADVWHNWNKWSRMQSARRAGVLKRYEGNRFVPKRFRD